MRATTAQKATVPFDVCQKFQATIIIRVNRAEFSEVNFFRKDASLFHFSNIMLQLYIIACKQCVHLSNLFCLPRELLISICQFCILMFNLFGFFKKLLCFFFYQFSESHIQCILELLVVFHLLDYFFLSPIFFQTKKSNLVTNGK